ncbi:sulfite exporter TauE/SafE family protein, partial [Cupriavidus basilensis]
TTNAALRYGRSVRIYWGATHADDAVGFRLFDGGAYALTLIPADPLRKSLPFILVILLVYTVAKKSLRVPSMRRRCRAARRWRAAALLAGRGIGFYDGVFGPGTGSFPMIVFVRVFGYDFLHASASTKVVNLPPTRQRRCCWRRRGMSGGSLGLVMAVANVAGSQVGSRLALKHGSAFVRRVFIVVVAALIVKTAWDAFGR